MYLYIYIRINEYIPPRPPIPRQVGGVERAVLEFHSQTANISNMLLDQFRELYGEELSEMDNSQKAIDERYYKHSYIVCMTKFVDAMIYICCGTLVQFGCYQHR